jgi:hypothetical protein
MRDCAAKLPVRSAQGGPHLLLDDRTQPFLVDSLRLKQNFTITVDETSPPIAVNVQQVPHSRNPLACCWALHC